MGSFGTKQQQAVVSWLSLLITRSCMHDICEFWRWLRLGSSTAQIECSNENSGQHTASEVASHARQATGLAETAGTGRWVSSESVPTENPRRFHYLEDKAIFMKSSQGSTTCVVLLYCCTSKDVVDGRRGKNEKRVIMSTRPEP